MTGTRQLNLNRRRVRVTAWSWLCPHPAKTGCDSATEIVSTQPVRMKDSNLYEAPWAYCVWKHGKTNGHYLLVFFGPGNDPQNRPLEFSIANRAMRKQSVLRWGIFPQTPWNLPLCRQDSGPARAACARPRGIPAAESALGSHSCVALSSAQVSVSILEKKMLRYAK